jgi:hypothetical protein
MMFFFQYSLFLITICPLLLLTTRPSQAFAPQVSSKTAQKSSRIWYQDDESPAKVTAAKEVKRPTTTTTTTTMAFIQKNPTIEKLRTLDDFQRFLQEDSRPVAIKYVTKYERCHNYLTPRLTPPSTFFNGIDFTLPGANPVLS